tara:strand:+ start:2032 stop:2403 length:372 start_codon:yes stop_codon:yes gene_type:complete
MKNNIKVTSETKYIPDRSSQIKSYYFFSYKITIKNNTPNSVQLLSRYWHIIDGNGMCEDIHGPGVVGRFPLINPGGFYDYTSFCPLKTPIGFMEGSFRMKTKNDNEFDIKIDRFRLMANQLLN